MVKPKGLGRGLDALLGGDLSSPAQESLQTLNVTQLQPGKYQPRTHMDQESLANLAQSIQSQGLMQPIIARQVGEGRYEIIAGERRWRASQLAGMKEVPVLVRVIADEAALAMALIENIQREDLNPIEEANGIQRLIEEFHMTHEVAAKAVGRSRSAVTNLLRLQQLPEKVQDMVMHNQLDMGHARALLSLNPVQQLAAAEIIAQKGLSVREAEQLVKRMTTEIPPNAKPTQDQDTLRLQEELADALGADVQIQHTEKGTGTLKIRYSNLDQLDAIISKLRTNTMH